MDHFLRPRLRFEVVDSGPPDAPAVVLLHGFPQQPSTFEAVAARLNAEGLRTPLRRSAAISVQLDPPGDGTIEPRPPPVT